MPIVCIPELMLGMGSDMPKQAQHVPSLHMHEHLPDP